MRGADRGAVWAAASTTFSALLYLLHFATTISALMTFYKYEYLCEHASLASSLLQDPVCSAIRSGSILYKSFFMFWVCLVWLVMAHLTYTVVFWLTLDPREHPLRLAYFLPFIHLYRLLKLSFHTLNCQPIKDLAEAQRENNSLFNAIGASLETGSQFVLQFGLAMKVGERLKNTLDPSSEAHEIPINLIISLVVSLAAASYSTSVAMLPFVDKHMPLPRLSHNLCNICKNYMYGSNCSIL